MSRTRVKICGITRPEDGIAAANLGVDAIGLVFYDPSPRAVDALTAQRIVSALPPFVTSVGLFVNAVPETVREVLRRVPLDLLQFHGDEDPAYCACFARPFIKAVSMETAADPQAYACRFEAAAGLLLDTPSGNMRGGSGQRFNWDLIPPNIAKPIILAGGLNPENVAQAVRRVHPFGVDVSTGVESAKGIKNSDLMRAFMRGIETNASHT